MAGGFDRGDDMSAIRGTFKDGKIILDGPPPADWPDGAEVIVTAIEPKPSHGILDEHWPMTPEGITELLAVMDQIEPPFLSPEDEAKWHQALREQKEWELANWETHMKRIEDLFR